jgi:hypothetical protein
MRNFFSTTLLLIIIPVTLIIVCTTVIKLSIFTPSFIKKELANREIYSIAQKQLIEQGKLNNADPTNTITPSDIERFISEVITTSWLQQNTEQTIDRAFLWINSTSNTPLSLPVDLSGPKKQIIPTANSILEKKIKDELLSRNLPELLPCTPEAPKDSSACLLLQLNVVQLRDEYLKKLPNQPESFVAKIPDSIDLIDPVLPSFSLENATGTQSDISARSDEQTKQRLLEAERIKFQYQQIIRYYFIVLIGYLLLLLLYILINMKSLRRSVSSTGILLFIIGLPTCAGAVVGRNIVETKLIPRLQTPKELAVELQKLILTIISDIEYSFFTTVLVTGIILSICGILFVIWSRFIQKSNS